MIAANYTPSTHSTPIKPQNFQTETQSSYESYTHLKYEDSKGDKFELSIYQNEYKYENTKSKGQDIPKNAGQPFRFDMDEFKAQMRDRLLEMIGHIDSDSPSPSSNTVNSILYAVEPNTKVADVPEYWNAENTSQRIVDFATSFASVFEGGSEEFYEKIKEAIDNGYKQARDTLGNLPGASAQLFNDTYELTMEKLDKHFHPENFAAETTETSQPRLNLVA